MTKPKFIMTRCGDCNHIWKRPKYANRKCPKCGSTNVAAADGSETSAPAPEPEIEDLEELEAEGVDEESPPVAKAEKTKAKATAAAKASKGMSMSMAIPAKSTYIPEEELTAQEEMLSKVLAGVGIKQPTALAKILGRGPADNAEWIDKILNRHGISYQQRLLVHDVLFPDDMESGGEGKGKDQDDIEAGFGSMFKTMQRMWMMKMMQDMMGGGPASQQQQYAPAPPQQAEQLVTMIDEKGMPVMDPATGQPVKVPASMFMMYQMRRSAGEPSTLQQFMQFNEMQMKTQMEFYKAMAGGQGGSSKELQLLAEKMAAENAAKLQELNAQRMKEISESRSQSMTEITTLRSELKTKELLEEQDRRFAQHAAELRKQLEERERELDKVKDSRQGDALSVQTEIQRKTGEVVTDTIKGATQEMREGRKELRGIFTEQLKQQQLVDRAQGQQQSTTTHIEELSLDQVGQEIEGMEQQAGVAPPPQPQQPPQQQQRRRRRADTLDLSILVGEGQ